MGKGWTIRKKNRISPVYSFHKQNMDTESYYPIDTYESMLNQLESFPSQKIPIPKTILDKKLNDISESMGSVRYILDFTGDFFPWNRQIAFYILIWSIFGGLFWQLKDSSTGLYYIFGGIYWFGIIILFFSALFDVGGFRIRSWVERKQYLRWSQATRIETNDDINQRIILKNNQ